MKLSPRRLIGLAIIILGLLVTASARAALRPFWTEKSTFVEGNRIYFVGVASNAPTIEEGRKRALESANAEFSEYVGAADLKEVPLETQMTYEEPAGAGFNVYRLMWTLTTTATQFKQKSLYHRAAYERIAKDTADADKLTCGMTLDEAIQLMGENRATAHQSCAGRSYLLYGTHWYVFSRGVLQCEIPIQSFSPCDWCTNYQCPKTSG